MLRQGLKLLQFNFAKVLKVDVCRSWGFGRDVAFLQYQIGIEDPSIKLEITKAK